MSEPSFYELTPIMLEVIASGGKLKMRPRGYSMLPFIRPEQDEIVLTGCSEVLKKGGVYLYRRSNGDFVLHRLIKKRREFFYFRGDNQIHLEQTNGKNVIALLESVRRNGKDISANSLIYTIFRMIAFPWCVMKKIVKRISKVFLF